MFNLIAFNAGTFSSASVAAIGVYLSETMNVSLQVALTTIELLATTTDIVLTAAVSHIQLQPDIVFIELLGPS